MTTRLDVSRTQLLVAAVLLVLAAPAPLRGVAAQPGPPGGAPPGRSIVDEVPADENGHRKLWMNWLCTRDNPLSDAGCRNLTLGQLEAWEGGLPKGIDLVTRDGGPGASDASQRDNGQPFSEGGRRLLAQQGAAGRAPGGPRRGLLAVTNWNFPADITSCVQAMDVQRGSLTPVPATAPCGSADLIGSTASNTASDWRAFPPGPNFNLWPDMQVSGTLPGGGSGPLSYSQCQQTAGSNCQTSGYYTRVTTTSPVVTPSTCAGQRVARIELVAEFRAPAGNQYDRPLALWANDAVLFHGTTSEPSSSCTSWAIRRDVTHLRSLFDSPQAPTTGAWMELDNWVDVSGLTSPYWARAYLTFYPAAASDSASATAAIATRVVGLGNVGETWGRWFMMQPSYPTASATARAGALLPSAGLNYRAMLELFTDPHGCEFWYTRQSGFTCSDTNTVMSNQYRELQVLIDGTAAALQSVYPTWYTGGYSPATWKTMAGHTAHMGAPHLLDITPWVHHLNDGGDHTISFQIGNEFATFWYISANLLLWSDPTLTSLTQASETLTTPSLSPIALVGSSGTLAAPRVLRAARTFSAVIRQPDGTSVTATLSADIIYNISRHSNTVSSTGGSWNNAQGLGKRFLLTRDGARLHNIQSDFAWANSGTASTSFSALMSFNQTDAASTFASGLAGAAPTNANAAQLAHWQGSLAPSGNCNSCASSSACSVPAMTCGRCRTSRTKVVVTPAAGISCSPSSRFTWVTACSPAYTFDNTTRPTGC